MSKSPCWSSMVSLPKKVGYQKLLCKFSIIGLGNTLENVNDIKSAPYTVYVTACSVYEKLKEAHTVSQSITPIWEWLDKKCDNDLGVTACNLDLCSVYT